MPFVKGQKSFSTKGMKFYHKGDETKMFPEGKQPDGWVKGRSKKSNIESSKKRKDTNLKKYGVENPAQSKEVKEKIKETNIKKYGVDNISKSEYAKEKKKETTLRHYGVDHPSQSEEVKEKIRKTNLERYGVEYPLQAEEFMDKFKETCLERYGVENVSQSGKVKEKVKGTNLERYGVVNPMHSSSIKEKVKQTNLGRYGVEYPLQDDLIKEKVKQTNLGRYGVEYPLQSEEVKEKIRKTNLERYGVEYSLQSEEVKGKIKSTNLERYGVENVSQSEEVKEKIKVTNLEKYNTQWFCNTHMCTSSKKNPNHSYSNNSFKDLLDIMKVNYMEEFPIDDVKSGTSYRYDFKVGKYLIEIDSTAYHNSYKHPFNKPKDKFYHQKKSKFAYSHGFVCIHIFDWNEPEEVLSSMLRGSLEISGFVEPRLFLYNSKEDRVIKYSDDLDVSRLVEEGYLPIYDDGVVLKDK